MEKHEAEDTFTQHQHHFNQLREHGYHPRQSYDPATGMMTLILHHDSVDPDQCGGAGIDPESHPDKYHRIDNINPMVIQHWMESRMQRLSDIGFNHLIDRHPRNPKNTGKVYPKGHHDLVK